MSLAALRVHAGEGGGQAPGMPRLVSVKGRIYDVTSAAAFASDKPLARIVGHEASRVLATGVLQDEDLDRSLEGISFDDHRRLEKLSNEMEAAFTAVARLAAADYRAIFGGFSTLDGGGGGADGGSGDGGDGLHALIAQQDVDGVRQRLQEDAGSINRACSRTGLSPLHKAVEEGSTDIVQVLLAAGADRSAHAALYDGDTPLQLARRLRRDDIAQALEGAAAAVES
ncbi:hypothetical protein JKP88DRAFT_214650 [Tribonema minus]|uniref:Cytochrome b5 heme-binding domain-containing protein n=1 Tax=Tribonema minus TaxID=303371 RepID=A0A836CHM5_9STRA|nr:hypothetical protein JKP88DRAFT_214650 [Tribonema minus]